MRRALIRLFSHRSAILLVIFMVMSIILAVRLFSLQIIHGQEYEDGFADKTTKVRRLEGTRGNIYDCEGRPVAYNELSNAVLLEDSGSYENRREKNLSLNGEIYRLIRMIEGCGDSMVDEFHIDLDENGNFIYDVGEGRTRDRFRADIYGKRTISELTEEEKNATPYDIMALLTSNEYFALYNADRPYTEEELTSHGLPLSFTREEELKIVRVRYQLFLTSYRKYVQVTIASNVSNETVAAIMENMSDLIGVSIGEESLRVYNYAESMAPLVGYTGKPSEEELEELAKYRTDYTSSTVVGKAGIEQYMETYLQGYDGSVKVAVNNLGKVLSVYEDTRIDPRVGNDVYLTIDAELQNAVYQILEQRIAGIVVSNIVDAKYQKQTDIDAGNIVIPAYDVYTALVSNSVVDIEHFAANDASPTERSLQVVYEQRRAEIFSWLENELLGSGGGTKVAELPEEYQAYARYIAEDFLVNDTFIIKPAGEYTKQDNYINWKNGALSLKEYIESAIVMNWLDMSILLDDTVYLDSEGIYQLLYDYMKGYLSEDLSFDKLIYNYMLYNDYISPYELIVAMYDQGILTYDALYEQLLNGRISPCQLIMEKISSLEIKPKQLALDPCSGSMVVLDPNTGYVKALVTYPGYDNNRLANTMDTDYYNELLNDLSTPFYNKATQQLTAPGSTFKPVMAAAGLNEGVIDDYSIIDCNGLFGEGLVEEGDQLHCWYRPGHGDMDVVNAIGNSCNVFFCTISFRLGLEPQGVYIPSKSLAKIYEYSSLLNLDTKTGIQIAESEPSVSDSMPIPSAIGQGTHLYTTTQLARYAATLRNNGTSFKLNLIDRVQDPDGTVMEENSPEVAKDSHLPEWIWYRIREGMRLVITENQFFENYPVVVYGKTGTAEESKTRPNHALFVGYSHMEGYPDIAFATRIANGYSSTNALLTTKDMLDYYYHITDDVLTGESATEGLSSEVTD